MPPLKVEYAKSGRSKCALKACQEVLEQGELRIGTGNMMPGAEDFSYKWRHLCCFTKRQLSAVSTVDQLEGFDDLDEGDQKLMLKLIKGQLIDKAELKGAVGRITGSKSPTKKQNIKNSRADEFGVSSDEDTDPPFAAPKPSPKKKKKDPNAPKRPVSAFMYFQKEKLPEAKSDNPGVPVKDVRKMVAKLWDELEDEKGKPYRDLAREDKKRYETALKKYENKGSAAADSDSDSDALPPPPSPPPPPPPAADSDEDDDNDAAASKKGDCKYGANCYRTNPEHLRDWNHPTREKNKSPPTTDSPAIKKPKTDLPPPTPTAKGRKRCEYGSSCFRTAPQV